LQYTEKVRVYALAKMLNMESKALLEMCQKAGISAKNQLSCLEPEQCTAIEQMVKRGSGGVATAPPPVKPVTPQVIQDRVRVIEQRRSRPAVRPPAPVPTAPPTPVPAEVRAAPIPTVSVPVEPTALGAAEVEPPTPADLAPTSPRSPRLKLLGLPSFRRCSAPFPCLLR
jgi:translation initiation factor IF-2